ncbi:MAG: hypothetical protein WBY53_14810 [Acidobacteriaceae bacterium]
MNPFLASQFETAFQHLYRTSNPEPLLQLADELLHPNGGRLFATYRHNAPTTWRKPPTPKHP